MELLIVLLGQIPEAVFISLFLIFTKNLRNKRILLDDVNFVEPLLDYRYDRVKTYPGDTVQDVLEYYSIGTYLVTMNGHITVIRDGVVYDTFDCRNRVVKSVWEVL